MRYGRGRAPSAGSRRAGARSSPITASSTASPATATCASRVDLEEARKRVPEWAKLWEGRGYPHPFLMMQITNIRYHDNGSPQAALPDFIRRFNNTDPAGAPPLHHALRFLRPAAARAGGAAAADAWRLDRLVEFRQRQHGPRDRAGARRPAPSRRRARPRRLASGRGGRPPPDAPRYGAAVAGALRRAHLGRRPLDPRAALARDAHAASPEARLCAGRREPRAHAPPRRPRAPGGRRRRRSAPAPRLQPAPVPGPPVVAAALPAAARRRARTSRPASAQRPSCRPAHPRTASSGRT